MPDPLRSVLSANFPGLSIAESALQALSGLVPLRKLARGRTLFTQGQPTASFYAVASGEIETRFSGLDGAVSVLEHARAPRIFGLAAFAAQQPSSYEALAGPPTQLLVFGPQAYRLLMDEVPGFARALLREFAQRYDGTLRLLEASRHRTAPERFGLALAQLARERAQGAPDAAGWLTVAATQAELAALANLSRQTVNQLLREATAEGRVQRSYGCLRVRP
jgi:CRP/FNR family cyclic AMP-dependent transcriptional regulator